MQKFNSSILKYKNSTTGEFEGFPLAVGKSAYDIAKENGYEGTEEEWIDSLKVETNESFIALQEKVSSHTHDWESIENRPFYEEKDQLVTVLEEQTVNGFAVMQDTIYGVQSSLSLTFKKGAVYTVNWDNEVYSGLKVQEASDGSGVLVLGNENYYNMVSGGDIPFAVISVQGMIYFATESTSESHSIGITAIMDILHHLDNKFLNPIETVSGDTLTWDGNVNELASVDGVLFKVSDIVITKEDCANGISATATIEGTTESSELSAEEIQSCFGDDGFCSSELFIVVPTDNYAGEYGTIPEKGIYLANYGYAYVSSLTVYGYTGFVREQVKLSYLPTGLVTQSYITNVVNGIEFTLNNKSDTNHTHDDRYYTETEMDSKLSGKSDTGHTHIKSEITDFAHEHTLSEITDYKQVDYNQSNSESSDYIKNRPFYDEYGYLPFDGTWHKDTVIANTTDNDQMSHKGGYRKVGDTPMTQEELLGKTVYLLNYIDGVKQEDKEYTFTAVGENSTESCLVILDDATRQDCVVYSVFEDTEWSGISFKKGLYVMMVEFTNKTTSPTTTNVWSCTFDGIDKGLTPLKPLDNKYLEILEDTEIEVSLGDTLTWDGNTDGHVVLTPSESLTLCKVSDNTPDYDTVVANGSVTSIGTDGVVESAVLSEESNKNYTTYATFCGGLIYIIYEDNVTVSGLTFSEKGIYFPLLTTGYIDSLVITGYNFTETKVDYKIKESYLPILDITEQTVTKVEDVVAETSYSGTPNNGVWVTPVTDAIVLAKLDQSNTYELIVDGESYLGKFAKLTETVDTDTTVTLYGFGNPSILTTAGATTEELSDTGENHLVYYGIMTDNTTGTSNTMVLAFMILDSSTSAVSHTVGLSVVDVKEATAKLKESYLPTPDSELSETSERPVQNKVVTSAIKTLKESIVEEVSGDTLTWDGNTEGLVSVDMTSSTGSIYYKVSNLTPNLDDFENGFTVKTTCNGTTTENQNEGDVMEFYDGLLSSNSISFFVCHENAVGVDNDGVVFPESGVYFMFINSTMYTSSLTINGYTGFTTTKIKEELLPEHIDLLRTNIAEDGTITLEGDWLSVVQNADNNNTPIQLLYDGILMNLTAIESSNGVVNSVVFERLMFMGGVLQIILLEFNSEGVGTETQMFAQLTFVE